jgi:hypothetical protein
MIMRHFSATSAQEIILMGNSFSITPEPAEVPSDDKRAKDIGFRAAVMSEHDFSAFHAIAERFRGIQKQAEREFTIVVNDLIRSNCRDANRIAYTLDGLLSYAGDGECLMLYRRLCKHLHSVDPEYAVDYVRYWQDEWDEERERFGKGTPS